MIKDYSDYMTGITDDMPDEIFKIAQLIELSVFKPVFKKSSDAKSDECQVVYLMNDAVESYIVLKNAVMTGEYLDDCSDETDSIEYIQTAGIQRIDDGYMLIVNQENNGFVNTFTIKFSDIALVAEYYSYGEIGHFWIKKYEYMRQLEYELAVVRDKRRFMGDDVCNDKEKILSLLADYPPIKAYPSVSEEYYVPHPNAVSDEATEYLLELCKQCGDMKFYKTVKAYGETKSIRLAKRLTRMFVSKKHKEVVFLLIDELREASKSYGRRTFPENEVNVNRIHSRALEVALKFRDRGKKVICYREEPFIYEKDSIAYAEYLLVFDKGIINNHCRVIEIS